MAEDTTAPEPSEASRTHHLRWGILIGLLALWFLIHEFLIPVGFGTHLLSIAGKALVIAALVYLVFGYKPNPLTQKKFARFRSIRRGYFSFVLLIFLLVLTLFGKLIIDKRAIIVKYDGKYYFPTYTAFHPGTDFGLDYNYETDYRELREKFREEDEGNWVLMPLIPFDPVENDYYREDVKPPYPPDFSRRHLLGTDKTGRDVFARLFYGFRIAMVFALVFTASVYAIGVAIGCAMGYFGGKTDLFGQRLVEIWSNIPFLYVVIIMVSLLPPGLPINMRIALLLLIMVMFSWTAMTYYMRTGTYKEKARDYVAASRLLGASTPRMIFVHVLPNTIATLVTFMPFTIAGAITSITALDFLGYGLPAPTPSWGELLKQGRAALHAPWIVASAFVAMTLILTLVTFVGEAVREAFDPKKFTIYQ